MIVKCHVNDTHPFFSNYVLNSYDSLFSRRSKNILVTNYLELLNDQFNKQLEAPLADIVMLLLPSIKETQKAIRRLKNNKAPVTHGIAADLFKNGGARLENEIHQIVTEVWDSETMLRDWNLGIIYPVYKNGKCCPYTLV